MTRRKKVIAPSIRRQVIAADNQRCRACGISDPDALQCDHIVPESKGGSEFLELLAVTRQQELESVRAEVTEWRLAGVRGVTIYNRLAKRFPARQVDKFMAK
jgi:5-methylcytosine-specific restriction endonuclease McrA